MFRYRYHSVNAAFQLLAILSIIVCYFVSRKFTFPEEEEPSEESFIEDQEENHYEDIDRCVFNYLVNYNLINKQNYFHLSDLKIGDMFKR